MFLSFLFFLVMLRPPISTLSSSSAASDVYKRQILILTKWGFLIGGFLVLAIGVCTYFSSWDKAKKTESAWDPTYPPLAGMDEALKHQDADEKKDIPEPDELAKRQTALTEALAKKERGETLDDAEKNLLEAYPDGTTPEGKGDTTEE